MIHIVGVYFDNQRSRLRVLIKSDSAILLSTGPIVENRTPPSFVQNWNATDPVLEHQGAGEFLYSANASNVLTVPYTSPQDIHIYNSLGSPLDSLEHKPRHLISLTQIRTTVQSDHSLFDTVVDLLDRLAALEAIPATPTGMVVPFAGSNAPNGWLICDGAEIVRADYASLFSVVGVSFGAGDGSTTFNIPDMRGYFVRGLGGIDPEQSTRVLGSVQLDRVGTRGLEDWTEQARPYAYGTLSMDVFSPKRNVHPDHYNPYNYRSATQEFNGFETRPANVAMNYIIKW